MTTQSEMKVIVKNAINELSKIENYMEKYAKLRNVEPVNWGDVQLAAYEFIQRIKEEMTKINLALSAYTRPDLQHIYANKNYDDYVDEIRKTLKIMQIRFENFKKYEYSSSYYPLPLDAYDDD